MIIEGVLRLGQFTTANAPSGVEGALYYDTTENKTKIYSSAAWSDLGGGWDGVLPNYTTAQRNDLSLADGLIVYNTTDDAVQIYRSGSWANVGAKAADGSICISDSACDSTHCVDGFCCDFECLGTVCQTCGALSSAGIGKCGYVNNSSQDPRNTCATATPPAADSCKSPTCSGTAYTCGYLSGEGSQPTCKRCAGGSYDPVNIANASQDTEGTNLCTAAHYRCDGSGLCTSPQTVTCVQCNPDGVTRCTCSTMCTQRGYTGCSHNCWPGCGTCWVGCTLGEACRCWNWTY